MKNSHQLTTRQAGTQAGEKRRPKAEAGYSIGARTPFDFQAQSLTPYGGLLPVATMLEKLGFMELLAECVTCRRQTRALSTNRFVLAIVLCLYVGFSRFSQFRYLASDCILTGILKTPKLPPQCTFWRFLASLHGSIARRLVWLQHRMRIRVWEAAGVQLRRVTVDTDTTVHTVFGKQMGGRVSYAPKKKHARSYQPIFTFMAETREYVAGQMRNGDRPSASQIRRHFQQVFHCLPPGVEEIRARADSGFYCWQTVEAYESRKCQFILVARKTARLTAALRSAVWRSTCHPEAEAECDFLYQPEGWPRRYRFIALRFVKEKRAESPHRKEPEQYELFEAAPYRYRVFVTNMEGPVYRLVDFYNHRCASENLIKEANHDVGMSVHPFHRFDMNDIHFQLAMLAYNLNCWLALFYRPPQLPVASLHHTTLQTARMRFLFIAARIWRHAGRVGVSYSQQCPERAALTSVMARLRRIRSGTSAPPSLAG